MSSATAYEAATAIGVPSVSTARACFVHSAIASHIWTRPVHRCLHVEQEVHAANVGAGGGGARAASADLTNHVVCVHPAESRQALFYLYLI